jgi:hypothetical protein
MVEMNPAEPNVIFNVEEGGDSMFANAQMSRRGSAVSIQTYSPTKDKAMIQQPMQIA